MSILSRFRIITKFLAVVVLMALVGGVVAYLGITSMMKMNEKAQEMVGASSRALMAARLGRNAESLSRLGFQLAVDPSSVHMEKCVWRSRRS